MDQKVLALEQELSAAHAEINSLSESVRQAKSEAIRSDREHNQLVDRFNNLSEQFWNQGDHRECQRQLASQGVHVSRIRQNNEGLQEELREEQKLVKQLRVTITEQEAIIAKTHEARLASLTQDFSCEFPDDMVRQKLVSFFEQDLQDWAIENCVDQIVDADRVAASFVKMNTLYQYPTVLSQLQFDLTTDIAAPVLLHAGLANVLCRAFLRNPYFLASARSGVDAATILLGCETEFLKSNAEDAREWRKRTMSLIENCIPEDRGLFFPLANSYVRRFANLVRQDCNVEELAGIVFRFAELAQRLWKLGTNIRLERAAAGEIFHSKLPFVEAHSTVGLPCGDKRLDGRPICVTVRPRILSVPMAAQGPTAVPVVWAKASVWVSNVTCEPSAGEPPGGF